MRIQEWPDKPKMLEDKQRLIISPKIINELPKTLNRFGKTFETDDNISMIHR